MDNNILVAMRVRSCILGGVFCFEGWVEYNGWRWIWDVVEFCDAGGSGCRPLPCVLRTIYIFLADRPWLDAVLDAVSIRAPFSRGQTSHSSTIKDFFLKLPCSLVDAASLNCIETTVYNPYIVPKRDKACPRPGYFAEETPGFRREFVVIADKAVLKTPQSDPEASNYVKPTLAGYISTAGHNNSISADIQSGAVYSEMPLLLIIGLCSRSGSLQQRPVSAYKQHLRETPAYSYYMQATQPALFASLPPQYLLSSHPFIHSPRLRSIGSSAVGRELSIPNQAESSRLYTES
ncbi:uncharacterized protein MYCFIDRAFT_178500 [Pseudocercospora fijiensis CIRAD86]|uniref:Uncharacterized protein n=1 Tax=Pseudocercospora fijiensis (strain CIRAD86) TaxID=383855 RepID=M3A1U2_PSEFD|nr:uncharacterized protein MYCFIDRAFT_178500 [Pseudocercospora fijiensis CIRAD86]EME78351.1 hypothetical protein MYCFIDRAFT_178500 [Pseudocercospora fijiensis CIRAD86]